MTKAGSEQRVARRSWRFLPAARYPLLALLAIIALPAMSQTISLDQYVRALARLQSLIASNQLATAQEEARRLSSVDVNSPQGRFHADSALLGEIAEAKRADVQLQQRIAVTIDEIHRIAPNITTTADPNLLNRVASEQAVPELTKGGELRVTPRMTPLSERIAKSLEAVWDWILKILGKIVDWIFDFMPGSVRRPGSTGGMRWIVATVVAAIVLLIVFLAFEVRRRARKKAAPATESTAPLGSQADADPLSRGASEWERYAAQLAQSERFREAIRAWYHAALVSCYAAGILHFRKSRTNWEYIAALAPSLAWRPEFISLTRRFEREWYGSSQSSLDAYDDCRRRARTVIDNVRGAA